VKALKALGQQDFDSLLLGCCTPAKNCQQVVSLPPALLFFPGHAPLLLQNMPLAEPVQWQ